VVPSREEDAHRALAHRPRELDLLLCEHHARVLSKNLTLQFRNVLYQVRHDGPGYRLHGATVTVCTLPSGEIALLYQGRELPYTTYRKGECPAPPADDKTLNARVDAALAKPQGTSKPRADHPWRRPVRPGAATDAPRPTDPAA
jgi:hypothetical protein